MTIGRRSEIVVVGCGIVGLTAAVRLQEDGFRVRIVARELPPRTTSNKAAAIWRPYRAAPVERVREWAERTHERYRAEYDDPRTGVREVELIEVGRGEPERPAWLRPSHEVRELAEDELPAGCTHGFGVRVPFVHSEVYLDRLRETFLSSGGEIESRALEALEEAAAGADAIVNCSGLGARELVPDPEVYGVRGQLAVVSLDRPARYIVDEEGVDGSPVYVLPRGEECFLGGTAEVGRESLAEDLETRERILERCRALEPALEGSVFLRSVVGVRPARNEVRLEREPDRTDPVVVHNYGHGGAGFTVGWGCADEVVTLLAG